MLTKKLFWNTIMHRFFRPHMEATVDKGFVFIAMISALTLALHLHNTRVPPTSAQILQLKRNSDRVKCVSTGHPPIMDGTPCRMVTVSTAPSRDAFDCCAKTQ